MMVARADEAKNHVIFKHQDETIPFSSQLTVDADEVAVFFKDGKVVAVMPPGRQTLHSANLPFLSDLVDSFTGGDVFKAEIFFVLTREVPNIKFGGKIGAVEDPKSGVPVVTMVHGTFSVRVVDPQKLILGLAGMQKADNESFLSWFREQTLKVIRDRIAELLVKQKWPLLDVTSGAYTEEIEQQVIEGVRPHVETYGVQVVRSGNFVINISDEDRENLKKLYTDAAYVRMAGGMQGFRQFAAGKAMMGAGEGMAEGGGGEGGNAMLGGAALGVGFGMAGMFQQQQAQGPQGPAGPMGGFQQGGGPAGGPAGGPGQVQPATPAPAGAAGQATSGAGVECAGCGAVVSPGKFCAECGQPLAPPQRFCPSCGQEATGKFCASCGTKIPE
jgi:membrane protease subunit (stomatin/prohibitin family)